MEIRQLTYFKTIAETENISQASKRLHVSQPFLSRTIRSMEEELEVPLFNRSGRKISLTRMVRFFIIMQSASSSSTPGLSLTSNSAKTAAPAC